MKKFIIGLLLIGSLSTMLGCNVAENRQEISKHKTDVEEKMKIFLKDKYGEEFESTYPVITGENKFGEGKWMKSTANVVDSEETFSVKYSIEEEKFYDNYETIAFKAAGLELFESLINKYWSDGVVTLKFRAGSECDTTEIHNDLDEFLNYDRPRISIRIYLPYEGYDETEEGNKAKGLIKEIYKRGLYGEFNFIYIEGEDKEKLIGEIEKLEDSYLTSDSNIARYVYAGIGATATDKDIEELFKNSTE